MPSTMEVRSLLSILLQLRVMLAGFVSPGLVASTTAFANAYAFYVLDTTYGVQRHELELGVCRWLVIIPLSVCRPNLL
jgi:hypothetical protein